MNLLVISDIHGNCLALEAVLNKANKNYKIDKCILLGDIIDYGPHSNEVIDLLKSIHYPVICNIWGNHEYAVINECYEHFSSERGKISASYTKSILNEKSIDYINNIMTCKGKYEFECLNKKCLAVHGSIINEYWGSITPNDNNIEYQNYDYVFSGHSHLPHFFEKYYKVDNPKKRNKKKTIFINPGSVGQPRNLNNMAQFAVLNIENESAYMLKVNYDIKEEQKAFSDNIDIFYKERLELGI